MVKTIDVESLKNIEDFNHVARHIFTQMRVYVLEIEKCLNTFNKLAEIFQEDYIPMIMECVEDDTEEPKMESILDVIDNEWKPNVE